MPRRLSIVCVVLVGCGTAHHVASCDDDLAGVWHAPDGAWLMLDNGVTLEAYPMQPDAPAAGSDLVAAPRALDLERGEHTLTGTMRRRFMRRADACEARATTRVTACRDDMLEVVTTQIATPIGVAPCRWPPSQPAHVERWTRD
jgi:hypothetical protein